MIEFGIIFGWLIAAVSAYAVLSWRKYIETVTMPWEGNTFYRKAGGPVLGWVEIKRCLEYSLLGRLDPEYSSFMLNCIRYTEENAVYKYDDSSGLWECRAGWAYGRAAAKERAWANAISFRYDAVFNWDS